MRFDRGIEKLHYRLHRLKFYQRAWFSAVSSNLAPGRRIDEARRLFTALPSQQRWIILDRVNYYNKLHTPFAANDLDDRADHYSRRGSSTYHLDFTPLINCFPGENRFAYYFNDCDFSHSLPTYVKSRPVRQSDNSVLLKLNSVRHYYLPKDRRPFDQKKPIAVWRGVINREHRRHFVEQSRHLDQCDIAGVGRNTRNEPWNRPYMSIREQLSHKFILSVEGVDVATNLKWVMASNSVCMMTRPSFETWFMEGRLIPGYHYIELKPDYSDLSEKIEYYSRHTDEAQAIIQNANSYVRQFLDNRREFLISLLVMDKYFRLSSQQTLFD